MRKSIDGLCAIIQEQFSMEIDHALFLFCGRKCDRIKAILKEPLSEYSDKKATDSCSSKKDWTAADSSSGPGMPRRPAS